MHHACKDVVMESPHRDPRHVNVGAARSRRGASRVAFQEDARVRVRVS